ncbi:MAG: TrkH family potassium uptake protein [Deltaproteobacteria bacterium]|nr:TrkH family potassium uptake protein [Deltaproteobacteria bacterium]
MQVIFLLHNMSLLIFFLGLSMSLPLTVSLIYGEQDFSAFLTSLVACMLFGSLLFLFTRRPKREISHREGFAIVAVGWIIVAFFGALPYFLSGALASFTDAFFESASGFTTTGATVVTNIEALNHATLMWRCFTQWLGGMGIILLSIAILPLLGVGGMQLYKAEVPGPVTDKLKPRIGETAKILWKVYLLFTFVEFILLRAGGMGFYDAVCHSFSTMATGGFSTKNLSVEAYNSAYIDGVITFFMLLAGTNFALHYQFLKGNFKALIKDEEFRFYLLIIIFSVVLVMVGLVLFDGHGSLHAFRLASFQVVSIMTTTGFSSVDFEQWTDAGKYFLLVLMFVGGCAGSTGGSIKVVRIYLLLKQGYRELYRLIHPHAVVHVKFNKGKVSPEVMDAILGFFFLYMILTVFAIVIMSFLGLDMMSAITSVAASIGNIGPGLGTVGPSDNFSAIPGFGKWILSFCMIMGRLELYTLLILFIPEFWRK